LTDFVEIHEEAVKAELLRDLGSMGIKI